MASQTLPFRRDGLISSVLEKFFNGYLIAVSRELMQSFHNVNRSLLKHDVICGRLLSSLVCKPCVT